MKFFCLHHKPATDRRDRLDECFSHHSMEVEWIELFQPEEIDFTTLNLSNRIHNDQALSEGEISLYMKHRHVIELQKSYEYSDVIIMEDDVILPYDWNMKNYFNQCLEEFDSMQGDILNIGTAFNFSPYLTTPDRLVYHEKHFTTRCAHCYSISNRCIDRVLGDLYTIDDAWDWKLNHLIEKYNLKSCYVEPGIHQFSLDGGSLLR